MDKKMFNRDDLYNFSLSVMSIVFAFLAMFIFGGISGIGALLFMILYPAINVVVMMFMIGIFYEGGKK